MIEAENLTKRYGNNLAVDHVSFQANDGEILGLLGKNGAGKTTIMRMLTGYMPPTEGTARVAGHDVVADSLAVRRSVGYMPEHVPLYDDMTVAGYVAFWARLRGVRKPKVAADAVLERMGLTDRRKSLVGKLSKGLRQRLGLAQALVHDPDVVILDEPTIGIDPQQVINVRAMVRELAEAHTVLFSTHILSEAEQVCDRVIIINEGHIVAQGTPSELRESLFPGDNLYVSIGGAESGTVEKALRRLPGVGRVERQAAGYALYAKDQVDLRQRVLRQVTDSGWELLELRPAAVTLEDIFLAIIEKEGKKR